MLLANRAMSNESNIPVLLGDAGAAIVLLALQAFGDFAG